MSIKMSLNVKLGQNLALTPQLQQAIQFLQLTSIELEQHIQTIIESNPLLETDETPSDLPDNSAAESIKNRTYEGVIDNTDQQTALESLADHLRFQANCAGFNDNELTIANHIIDVLDDDGFLTMNDTELLNTLSVHTPVSNTQLHTILTTIQSFEPAGVGAHDVRECLLIQLQQMPDATPYKQAAYAIIDNDLNLVARHDYHQLKLNHKLTEEKLAHIIQLIKQLNPRPGNCYSSSRPQYIIPDVVIEQINGKWNVRLNKHILPKIKINEQYAQLLNQSTDKIDNDYLRRNMQEARWLLKSLDKRNSTLLNVARYIAMRQAEFLEHGPLKLKPMIIHDAASAIDVHDSTISRVTNGKYAMTPQGVFELKYFFSSHVSTTEGENISSTAIQTMIKNLIDAENSKHPLSDQQLVAALNEKGIKVARRTVAKYREAIAIPSSTQRRSL